MLDQLDVMQSYMSIRAHYVIRMSGMVEIGRDPNTISSHRRKYLSDQIVVQLVGGLDPETGHTVPTATKEQLEALEELLQMLADTLNTALAVDDKIAAVEAYHAAKNGAAYTPEDDDDQQDDDLTDTSEGNNLHDHQIN